MSVVFVCTVFPDLHSEKKSQKTNYMCYHVPPYILEIRYPKLSLENALHIYLANFEVDKLIITDA